MKYNLLIIVSIMFILTPLFADNFSDVKIEMRVNGHSHFLDNDINTGIIEYWQSKKDSIEIDVEEDDDVQSINLPDLLSYIRYIPDLTDNKLVLMK